MERAAARKAAAEARYVLETYCSALKEFLSDLSDEHNAKDELTALVNEVVRLFRH